jgi:uncharacterized iron-regulated protein
MNFKRTHLAAHIFATGVGVCSIIGCSNESNDTAFFEWTATTSGVVSKYSEVGVASYEASILSTTTRNTTLATLFIDPSKAILNAACKAWFVNEADAAIAAGLGIKINESLSLVNALQIPFDQEIAPGNEGNARVTAPVIGLQAQKQILFEVFDLFGLSAEIPE